MDMDYPKVISAIMSAYRNAVTYYDSGIVKWSGGGFSGSFNFETFFRRPSLYKFCRHGTWVGIRNDLPAEPTHVVLGKDSTRIFVANFVFGKAYVNEYGSLTEAFWDEAPYSGKIPHFIARFLFEDKGLGEPIFNRRWQIATPDASDVHVLERSDEDLGVHEEITIARDSMLIRNYVRRVTRENGDVSTSETSYLAASVAINIADHVFDLAQIIAEGES